MGEQVKREIAVMKMVKHQHVVNLLEVLASRTKIFIVLELVTGGEVSFLFRWPLAPFAGGRATRVVTGALST